MAHLVEAGTPWVGRLGRQIIFGLDDQLRRFEGIYAFSQDPNCLLRISRSTCQKERILGDGTVVHAGDAVIELHWWNERIANLASTGSSLHWGLQFYRHTYHSLLELARCVDRTPGLRDVVALHGETTFSSQLSYRHHARAFRRVGFELEAVPPGDDFWETLVHFSRHFHVWALTWACNPTSLRHRHPWAAVRSEMWISRHALLERCIGAASPPIPTNGHHRYPAGAVRAERVLSGATVKPAHPRISAADTASTSGSPDAWQLLRAYMRSHYSSWRR